MRFRDASLAAALGFGLAAAAVFGGSAACGTVEPDKPSVPDASVYGPGAKLRDVTNPANSGANVHITSAVVVGVDTYDETRDGKSRGTVYVEDLDKQGPFGGVGLFSPTFEPGNLRPQPGDVLDISGQYVEETTIGSTVNFGDAGVLTQLVKPQCVFRFDQKTPNPVTIPFDALKSFTTARPYLNMLVKIENVPFAADLTEETSHQVPDKRFSAPLTSDLRSGPKITNEFFPLDTWNAAQAAAGKPTVTAGTTFASVTGIITFFFNVHIAPRSADDIVP